MAIINAKVNKVKTDKRGRACLWITDTDTNQSFNVWPRKDCPNLFDGLQDGDDVVLNGTFHTFPAEKQGHCPNIKMIARS